MKTKLFSLFLALVASVGTMSASTKIGDLYYNLDATNLTAEVTYQYEYDANNYSGLTSIVIPSTVTYNAQNYSVTSIGERAFYNSTGLTSVDISNSVTSIGSSAFAFCTGLTSVDISNSVTSIGSSAFSGCTGLTSITIPNSVTSIGDYAFANCSGLTSVTIPNGVTSIGDYAFANCSGLTSITIPNSVTSIGDYAFAICSGLTSLTIGNSVTSIGSFAFSGCSGLTSITIPNSVTSIGDYAFAICSGLTSVTNHTTTPQSINSNVFVMVNTSSCTLYVPEESIDLYEAANVWKEFGNIVTIVVEPTSAPAVYTNPANPAQKLIRNGNVYILTGNKTYTVTGQEVR